MKLTLLPQFSAESKGGECNYAETAHNIMRIQRTFMFVYITHRIINHLRRILNMFLFSDARLTVSSIRRSEHVSGAERAKKPLHAPA